MGIFGKLFKKTEVNKCEICGEIIHSDFLTCSSCEKTSATTSEAPTFNGINPKEQINLMLSTVNINGETVFAQWLDYLTAEEVSKSLEEGINIFEFYIKYYFFQEFNSTSLDIDEEKSLFTRFKKDRVFRERLVMFFPNKTEFFHKTIIEAVGKELITNKNFENTNKIIESKRQGLWVTYYENGNLNELSDSQRVDFINHGIKPKKLQELVPTVVMGEGTWKDNQRVGLWKFYNKNGTIQSLGEFKDGKKVGLWEVYDENGQLIGGVNTDGDKDEIFDYTPENISIITFFNKYISKENNLNINTTSSFINNTYYGKFEDDDRGTILIFFEKVFDVVEEFKNIIELHCSQNPFLQLSIDEIANWIISYNDGVIEYNNIEGCSIQLSKGVNLYRIDVIIEDAFSWNIINKVNTQKSLIFTFPFTSPIKYRLPKDNFNFNETESLILISIYFYNFTFSSEQKTLTYNNSNDYRAEIPLYDNLFDEDTINIFINTEEFKRFWAYACINIFVDTVDPLQTDFFENIFNVLKENLSSFEMLNLSFTFINKPQKIISIKNNDLESIVKKYKKVKLISELTRLNNFFNILDGEFILFSMMKKQMTLVEPYLNRFKDLQDLFESMKNESSDSAIELRKKIVGDMPLNLIDRPTNIRVEKDEVSNTSSDKSITKEEIECHDNGEIDTNYIETTPFTFKLISIVRVATLEENIQHFESIFQQKIDQTKLADIMKVSSILRYNETTIFSQKHHAPITTLKLQKKKMEKEFPFEKTSALMKEIFLNNDEYEDEDEFDEMGTILSEGQVTFDKETQSNWKIEGDLKNVLKKHKFKNIEYKWFYGTKRFPNEKMTYVKYHINSYLIRLLNYDEYISVTIQSENDLKLEDIFDDIGFSEVNNEVISKEASIHLSEDGDVIDSGV